MSRAEEDTVIAWEGPPPSPVIVTRLAPTFRVEPSSAFARACVVATDVVPARTPAGPWIWAPRREVSPDEIAACVSLGAYDVVAQPVTPGPALAAAERLFVRLVELARDEELPALPPDVVSRSAAAQSVLRQLARAARTSMPVLLTGETGTGKEVSARLLHEWSERRARRFIPINCAAIPNELIEAELFGYAKGAFTGSVKAYEGQFSAAEGGTVFLDEVDDTPLPFQVKLLRVLEDRVVTRIGENDARRVDFRILAATNRELEPLVASGGFGADLHERLAIVEIRLPPLRERAEDLPPLVTHMIARFYREEPSAQARHAVEHVTPEAMRALAAYPWPGNVRELRNVIFAALVHKNAGRDLLLSDLPRRILRREGHGAATMGGAASGGAGILRTEALDAAIRAGGFDLADARADLERRALEVALELAGGNAARAADWLGRVGRGQAREPGSTVRAMMTRLGLGNGVAKPPPKKKSKAGRAKTGKRGRR